MSKNMERQRALQFYKVTAEPIFIYGNETLQKKTLQKYF